MSECSTGIIIGDELDLQDLKIAVSDVYIDSEYEQLGGSDNEGMIIKSPPSVKSFSDLKQLNMNIISTIYQNLILHKHVDMAGKLLGKFGEDKTDNCCW